MAAIKKRKNRTNQSNNMDGMPTQLTGDPKKPSKFLLATFCFYPVDTIGGILKTTLNQTKQDVVAFA